MMAEEHQHGFVSKCLVSSCAWNGNNQCNAPGISISKWKENHDCVTWLPEEEL
jgi:hypothetical protein